MPRTIILTVLSAFFLVTAYPKLDWWPLAWVALVPLLFAINGKSKPKAFLWTLLFGFLFFFFTLGWLIYVTAPGAVILPIYLALYPAFFAIGFIYFQKLSLTPRIFVLSALWTVLEFIRANLFTGFGWATLGHSQYKNLLLIQISDIVGIYGISFLVILVNLFVFETLRAIFQKKEETLNDLQRLQFIISTILVVVLCYGIYTFSSMNFSSRVRVAVIQPNIAQKIKWDPRYMQGIIKQTLDLTDEAAKKHPDIILWPETSLPGVLSEQPAYLQQIQLKAMDLKTPIMMGAIEENLGRYYNSAVLIGPDGTIQGHHNKIHLVPFGEFLPLRPVLGWLNKYIGLEDFTSGKEYTIFFLGQKKHSYGVLICFEDALNDMWRTFTRSGASFMMNMTNDAWFMDTKEPFLHLQGAVFECVQNKRSLARAANTGVSGFIDPLGRIIALAEDKKAKKTFVSAFAVEDIPVNKSMTFYTKYADVFTYLCFLCILWGVWRIRKNA